MIKHLQAFIGAGTNPHRNLAIEEYLTDTVPEDTLIVYLWQNKHTVVIGRNQTHGQNAARRNSSATAGRLQGGFPAAVRSTMTWGTSTLRSLFARRTMT